jgi:hypothetical protein
MHSAPGGRPLRQSLIRPLEADIAREAKPWWTERAEPPQRPINPFGYPSDTLRTPCGLVDWCLALAP